MTLMPVTPPAHGMRALFVHAHPDDEHHHRGTIAARSPPARTYARSRALGEEGRSGEQPGLVVDQVINSAGTGPELASASRARCGPSPLPRRRGTLARLGHGGHAVRRAPASIRALRKRGGGRVDHRAGGVPPPPRRHVRPGRRLRAPRPHPGPPDRPRGGRGGDAQTRQAGVDGHGAIRALPHPPGTAVAPADAEDELPSVPTAGSPTGCRWTTPTTRPSWSAHRHATQLELVRGPEGEPWFLALTNGVLQPVAQVEWFICHDLDDRAGTTSAARRAPPTSRRARRTMRARRQ